MSIFSKLFPGGVKGDDSEDEVAARPPSPAGERGPSPKASPPAAAAGAQSPKAAQGQHPARPASPGRYSAAPPGQPNASSVPNGAAGPNRPVAPAPPQSTKAGPSSHGPIPASPSIQGLRPLRPGTSQGAPASSPLGTPGSYVSVSASRLQSGAPRPEVPAVAIGQQPNVQPLAPVAPTRIISDAPPPPVPAASPEPKRVSARPPTDPPRPNGGSIADTFERLLSSELDEGFASMQQPSLAPQSPQQTTLDLEEVRGLFAQLAANHVRSVRDFVIDLRWSDATVEWIAICVPALRSLQNAAEKLELADLCEALSRFRETLLAAQAEPARVLSGERRTAILERYDELSVLMPQAFALDLDRTQRETVILQSLLLQVPDVKKVTLDKLFAAGLSTLEAMFLATASDISATTGVAEDTAQRIVDRFRAYRDQVKATAPDAARTRERQRIADLTARLRGEQDAFEAAAGEWSRESDEKKKELRKARAQTLLDIQVELARLGEVQQLAELERLPFEAKVARLETFLEDARERYLPQP